jgi:hypothetical protein
MSISPVEKAPIKKYFNEASVPFRFRLSLPVSMYKGIDKISIPKKSSSNVLKVDRMEAPHKTKNIKLKYSDTWRPVFSKSLQFKRKINKVQIKMSVLK